MRHFIRRTLAVALSSVLIGACAHARPAAAGTSNSPLAGVQGVAVLVFSDLPDSYVGARGLRAPQIAERVAAQLQRDGVPVRTDEASLGADQPQMHLDLESMPVGDEAYAVWARVSLAEAVRLRRRPELPTRVYTWTRSAKVVVRGDDTALLWRQIDRLGREFSRELREANRTPGTDPVTAEGASSR